MKDTYVIFTDIDGTLIDHETGSISQSTIDALKQARENGHKVILSTGRTYADMEPHFFALPHDGMILGCGGHVIYENQTLHTEAMPKELIHSIVDFLVKNNVGFALEGIETVFLFGYAYDMYRIWLGRHSDIQKFSDEEFRRILEKRHAFSIDTMKEEDYSKILKLSFFSKNEELMKNYMNQLDESLFAYADHLSNIFFTGEIYMKSVNKATGMDHLLQAIPHPLEKTIALGDSLNDLEMIQHATIGVAMGNASEELKKQADYVTEPIHKDGFALALKKYRLIP